MRKSSGKKRTFSETETKVYSVEEAARVSLQGDWDGVERLSAWWT